MQVWGMEGVWGIWREGGVRGRGVRRIKVSQGASRSSWAGRYGGMRYVGEV